jgi:hypothetical protein
MSLKSQTLTTQIKMMSYDLPRDLGDGLVLRFATRDDVEPLAQLNGRAFGRERPDELAIAYTRHYASDAHPVIGPSNVVLVQDTRADKIVSTTCLIPQTWTYAGIPFPVGRPEMVATDPDYRKRGLVREEFKAIHALSESMGHLVQGITGILWYYRQFEYEYALDLSSGRLCYFSNVPTLKENETEPFQLRPMTRDDIPFAAPLYDRATLRSLIACPRPEWLWQYWLDDSPLALAYRIPLHIIQTTDGRPVGYVQATRDIWQNAIAVAEIEVAEDQSLRAVMPTVLRWMKPLAEKEGQAQQKAVNAIYFALGQEHPVFDAIPELLPKTRLPYAWYIRVPDLPRFILHIAPVLEARLAHSAMAGFSGELKISVYRNGYKLTFANGKLLSAETWQPSPEDRGDCSFPPLVFLQLLFGRKSLAELRAFLPDAWANDQAAVLLDAMFPKQPSCVCAVG